MEPLGSEPGQRQSINGGGGRVPEGPGNTSWIHSCPVQRGHHLYQLEGVPRGGRALSDCSEPPGEFPESFRYQYRLGLQSNVGHDLVYPPNGHFPDGTPRFAASDR